MTLRVDTVSWAAGGALVLDGISLAPEPGETIGLLGPNGSGKSSLIRLLHGLNRPSTGVVDLDGADLRTLDRRVIARAVAVVGQHAETDIDICVREVVRLGRIPRRGVFGGDRSADDSAVAAALERTGLTAKADHLWHTLSGGEKQRVQIARALAQEPRDLLLDEPTNHLDIHHQLELLTLVSRLPVTTIMAIHDLNLAAMFCDRVVVLRDGRAIASGRPRDVLTAELIADVYRVHAEIIHDEERDRLTIRYEPSAIPPGRLAADDEALTADRTGSALTPPGE